MMSELSSGDASEGSSMIAPVHSFLNRLETHSVHDSTANFRHRADSESVSSCISIVPELGAIPPVPVRSHGAYELKFLIDEERAQRIMAWARTYLDRDPHAGGESGDEYLVNSLYLDTPGLDVYHRSDLFRRRKYRLRRYGQESRIWMEVKRKQKGLVRKRRVAIEERELAAYLRDPFNPEREDSWFRKRLDDQNLQPACQVTYRRFARIGTTVNGSMRLTIDTDLAGIASDHWQVPCGPIVGIPLLPHQRILELKFQVMMPVEFRKLVAHEQLLTNSFSKYRTSVEECLPFDRISGDQS